MSARAKGERDPSPPAELAALEKALAKPGPLPRAFLVRGEERWFRDRALDLLVAAARARELEIVRHDAQDPDFALKTLCADLAALPMFSAARFVVARNAGALVKKEGGDDSPFVRAALAFLAGGGPEGTLVVEAESVRADSALAKAVAAKGGTTLTLRRLWDTPPPWNPDPRGTELVAWLVARAAERKIALKPDEALYVAAATGNDLYALDAALDRVARRGGEGVRSVVGWSSAASPFQVAEDLCRGDAARAVAGVEALFRSGFQEKDGSREADAGALIAVLSGSLRAKLRQTLAGAEELLRGADPARAAEAAGIPGNPRARSEFEARVRARPASEWRAMTAGLAELERKSRSGAGVDVNDFVAFALRWARAPSAPSGASRSGGPSGAGAPATPGRGPTPSAPRFGGGGAGPRR